MLEPRELYQLPRSDDPYKCGSYAHQSQLICVSRGAQRDGCETWQVLLPGKFILGTGLKPTDKDSSRWMWGGKDGTNAWPDAMQDADKVCNLACLQLYAAEHITPRCDRHVKRYSE